MGTPAFRKYLASIQALIGVHIGAIESLERKASAHRTGIRNGIDVEESQTKLDRTEYELGQMRSKIDALKNFFVEIKKRWSRRKDRVIGFVRWAPPIGVGVPPHRYTRDLCVIQLYKEKFKHMSGNVLSLGAVLLYFH